MLPFLILGRRFLILGRRPAPLGNRLIVVEGADIAAFTGSMLVQGLFAATDGPDAAAFSGTVSTSSIGGDFAVVEGADVAAFSGQVIVQGALAVTDGADIAAFTGDATPPASEALAPDAIAASSNLIGVVSAIQDDPDDPDGSWLISSTAGAADCRVTFPTPTSAPATGAGLQTFEALIRKNSSGGNDVGWSLELFENAVSVAVLATGTTASTTGEVVSGTWDAASLGTADGSLVECRLVQTSGHTGSPSGRRYLEIGALEWDASQ